MCAVRKEEGSSRLPSCLIVEKPDPTIFFLQEGLKPVVEREGSVLDLLKDCLENDDIRPKGCVLQ